MRKLLRTLAVTFLAIFIAFLTVTPLIISSNSSQLNQRVGVLANSNYTENLSIFTTSSQTLWEVHLSGGSVNVSDVTVPSSVSAYSITLTSYNTWQSSYEIFSRFGFGLLGGSEPYQSGALLVINSTSSSGASSLANSLGQRFGLAFVQVASSSSSYSFYSPIDYVTELDVYFYPLVPQSAGGFASIFTRGQFESNGLNVFQLDYSGSTYSLTLGGITPLSSENFTLYGQFGLSQSYNYSSLASSSTIDIHVLGGQIYNSSLAFSNNISNLSASIATARTSNNTIPNIAASFNFSFPTILAYRQVTPTLTPATGTNITVTIKVTNISPSATATNVFVNDSWIYSEASNFHLTQTQTSNNQTLTPTQSYTVIYAFTVTATTGAFQLPATPVTYQYSTSNKTIATGQAFLNPETLVVSGGNTPELEATATVGIGTQFQSGQPYFVNVTIVNKGNGAAFSLNSSGLSKQNLAPGETWSYTSNESSSSLTQTNAILSYSVEWQDAGGNSHKTTTNAMSTVLGFGNPGSPSLTLTKTVTSPVSGLLNVTLTLFNNSPVPVSGSSLDDSIPSGMAFSNSFNSTIIHSTGSTVDANLSSIASQSNESLTYTLSVTNPNENYVFLPASVSTPWNGLTIIHYSGGYGMPLGVVASKTFGPSEGFQGTNVTVSIGLSNKGSLPVYNVNLNNAVDSFLTVISSNSSSSAVLGPGSELNAKVSANLTGSPGVYNSSASAATFIFAGTNQTATSPVVTVNIFQLPVANLTYSALKVEEGHNIVITVTINNPSNVVISNVAYSISLPSNLRLVSGTTNFSIASIPANSSTPHSFTIITSQPYVYQFNGSKLTFDYQGHQLSGVAGSLSLVINDDIPLRYGIPGVIGILVVILTVIYVRRLVATPSLPKK